MLKKMIILIAKATYACILFVAASILAIIGYAILSIPLNITTWIGAHVVLTELDLLMQFACLVKSDKLINEITGMIDNINSLLN